MDGSARARFQQTAMVLLLALLVRSAVLYFGADSLMEDPDSYARLAVHWSESGVFGFEAPAGQGSRPTAFRPPLYPWLLSWLVADDGLLRTGVAGLHLAIGVATVWLTFSIGYRLGLRWTPLAGLAVAVDPLLLRASQLLMTETLATLLGLAAWRLWLAVLPEGSLKTDGGKTRDENHGLPSSSVMRRAVLLGLVFGLAILARPTAAPWAGLCAASLFFAGGGGWRRRLTASLLVLLGIGGCILPWTLRNLQQMGHPIWATSHGGYTLLLANNPTLYQHFINKGPSRDWAAESFHTAWADRDRHPTSNLLTEAYWTEVDEPDVDDTEGQIADVDPDPTDWGQIRAREFGSSELADDALAYSIARATIAREPETFAMSMLYRVGWFWAPWPNASLTSPTTIAIGTWYACWFAMAIAGGWYMVRAANYCSWLPLLFLILALTAVHSIYWSNMRFRAPLMPGLYLLALHVPLPTASKIQARRASE